MTLVGVWENEYGSRMTLSVEGRQIVGVYESTTGSTGQYLVSGWQLEAEPTAAAGQPVALAIERHSVVSGPSDASWNWVSALGGQINIVDGEDVLILDHLMVASSEFVGLCDRGIFADKLTYRRVPPPAPPEGNAKPGNVDQNDPLAGAWVSADHTILFIQVRPDTETRFGYVSGTMQVASGLCLELTGFTDVNAVPDRLGYQSVSIAARNIEGGQTLAFGGWIELCTGRLTLQKLTSHITPANANYVQTDIWSIDFARPRGQI